MNSVLLRAAARRRELAAVSSRTVASSRSTSDCEYSRRYRRSSGPRTFSRLPFKNSRSWPGNFSTSMGFSMYPSQPMLKESPRSPWDVSTTIGHASSPRYERSRVAVS